MVCRRITFITLLRLVLFITASAQEQNKSDWLHLETSVTGDFIHNLNGGLMRAKSYIGMEEISLSIDLENLGLWKGGEVFMHGLNAHGRSPSQEIVGDLQVTSNIEAGDYTGFYEYYLKQSVGRFSFLFGQHDLNSEMAGTEYGGTFINSSFGIVPTMSLNIPVSIYPTAALAFIAQYEVLNRHSIKVGVYDGDPGDPKSNRYNLQPNISGEEGFLFVGEYDYHIQVNSLPHCYRVGSYYHTNTFTDYRDSTHQVSGNYGIYLISDYVLWSGFNHPDKYLGLFLQGSWAPSHINQVDFYLGAGIHFNGLLPQRYNDAIGLALAYAHISHHYRTFQPTTKAYEMTWELTYKLSVFDHYTIQPNLQYIVNPGVNPALHNAVVASLRFNIFLEN